METLSSVRLVSIRFSTSFRVYSTGATGYSPRCRKLLNPVLLCFSTTPTFTCSITGEVLAREVWQGIVIAQNQCFTFFTSPTLYLFLQGVGFGDTIELGSKYELYGSSPCGIFSAKTFIMFPETIFKIYSRANIV
jgi:hypothetical protein